MHFFCVDSRLIKEIDGWPMGSPVSFVFSDIFMCRMEGDVVVHVKPIFYKHYLMTHIYAKRKMLMMNYSKI